MGWNYLSITKLQRLHRWRLVMDKYFHPTLYLGCNYIFMLGLKLIHVSKSGPWYFRPQHQKYCHLQPPVWQSSESHAIDTLRWRHNGRDCVSNHQPHDCLLNRLFGRRSKLTSKLRVTGLCVGNSPRTGEFPAQMASNAENISISWTLMKVSSCLYNDTNTKVSVGVREKLTNHIEFCSFN